MNPLNEKLQQFVNDEVMYNAVKSVLLSNCDANQLEIGAMTNDHLGEVVRAFNTAKRLIEKSFKDLEAYRHGPKEQIERENVV